MFNMVLKISAINKYVIKDTNINFRNPLKKCHSLMIEMRLEHCKPEDCKPEEH